MAKIVWTQRAIADLDAIAGYIALDKPDAAGNLIDRIKSRVKMLEKFPEAGPRIPELLPDGRFRQIVEPPCRIFYRHDRPTDQIVILAVRRGEMPFQKRLLHRRDRRTQD